MPRWLWFAPLGLVVLMAGYAGLRLGETRATLTATEAIATYAARYVTETGGQLTDCLAVPADTDGVWLEVICEGAARRVYWVDRFGRHVRSDGPGDGA